MCHYCKKIYVVDDITYITLTSFPDTVSELNCGSSFTSTLIRCVSFDSILLSLFSLLISLLSFTFVVVDDVVTDDVVLNTDVVVAVVDAITESVVKHILDVDELNGVVEVVTIVVAPAVDTLDVVVVVVVVVVDVAVELF